MFLGRNVIAVVPARSGSKGVPDKNIRKLDGISLIGLAGECLSHLPWLDAKFLSTDSEKYAKEGNRYGIDTPFMRPSELSSDTASAVDTMVHALVESEKFYKCQFDILLIIEPTSPMRRPEDVEEATRLLIESDADSVVTVSPVSTKYHPRKILKVVGDRLAHYESSGEVVVRRQQLDELFIRNGVCYAVTRRCLLEKRTLFTKNTRPYIIRRELANIDEPTDFAWAEFLIANHMVDE